MYIKIPPHLACIATLPYETLTSAKQAINNKLQGMVRFLITKLRKFIAEPENEKKLKSVNIWQSYDQKRDCLAHFLKRYDTRCYFNVRSKADISQLNLPKVSLIYLK